MELVIQGKGKEGYLTSEILSPAKTKANDRSWEDEIHCYGLADQLHGTAH